MKKFLIIFSLAFGLMFWSNNTFAQAFPPPHHGSTGDQGSGAPIGTGVVILLGLGAAYGGKKLYDGGKNTPND